MSESVANLTKEAAVALAEAAYRAMHPDLLKTHFGQYVVVYNGELIDFDQDGTALYLRILQQCPDRFVLITPGQKEAEEVYVIYSPV